MKYLGAKASQTFMKHPRFLAPILKMENAKARKKFDRKKAKTRCIAHLISSRQIKFFGGAGDKINTCILHRPSADLRNLDVTGSV
jgi:hypothetical protein